MSSISTHVLDTSKGKPAPGIAVRLYRWHEAGWDLSAEGRTDEQGRISDLHDAGNGPGRFRMVFETGNWYRGEDITPFYPHVSVVFELQDDLHHHIPLLISPFGYSTYRGS